MTLCELYRNATVVHFTCLCPIDTKPHPCHGEGVCHQRYGGQQVDWTEQLPISTIVYCFQWKMKEASQTSTLTKESTEIELRELNL